LRQENANGGGGRDGRGKKADSGKKCHDRQSSPFGAQDYVRHRPITRGRAGSATELNAGSQPTGTDTGNGDVPLDFVLAGLTGRAGLAGRRSLLSTRLTLTEGPDAGAFGAVAAQTTEAMAQLRNTAATTCFRLQPKISDMARALRPPRPGRNYSALHG